MQSKYRHLNVYCKWSFVWKYLTALILCILYLGLIKLIYRIWPCRIGKAGNSDILNGASVVKQQVKLLLVTMAFHTAAPARVWAVLHLIQVPDKGSRSQWKRDQILGHLPPIWPWLQLGPAPAPATATIWEWGVDGKSPSFPLSLCLSDR